MWNKIFNESRQAFAGEVGYAFVRISCGLMMALGHGWPKLQKYSDISHKFPDPLGIGNQLSMASAIGAELVCGALLALGLLTRWVSLPLIFTMVVAAFMIHGENPWFSGPGIPRSKELALLYLIPFIYCFLRGCGTFSLDALFFKSHKQKVSDAAKKSSKK